MNIKAIFFDVDGTLFGSEGRIPASALQALTAARKKGIRLFVATGRMPMMLSHLREAFDFDGCLTMNGQYCFLRDGRVLHRLAHDTADLRRLVTLGQSRDLPCLICEESEVFMLSDTPFIHRHCEEERVPLPPVYDPARIGTHDVYQLITYDTDKTDPALLGALKAIRITTAGGYCHDVIPAHGGKDVGIRHVADALSVAPSEILVFGDGLNDVEMLSGMGFSVAMGNACPEAIAAADFVTTHVDQDGIANALYNLQVI